MVIKNGGVNWALPFFFYRMAKGVASLFLILAKSQNKTQSHLLLSSNAFQLPEGGNVLCFKYAVNENK